LERLVNEFEAMQRESKGKTVEPLRRGPLVINSLGAMGSSVVAEVSVEATFRLLRDAQGKWRVSEAVVGGEPSGDLAQLFQSANTHKATRARADLEVVRAALEDFRRERGFYVVAEDSVALMDHLSPRYIKRIIRLDPWHNPYRYAGTATGYALNSDGPDGKSGTADDVTVKQF
ncbi:MAG TPA: type II secretion system protein GspG, partial [Pyrinomonadaceae bacterium]|nr:type II secretion system protein GspG [Pyrinomonadaceae bacterium]